MDGRNGCALVVGVFRSLKEGGVRMGVMMFHWLGWAQVAREKGRD